MGQLQYDINTYLTSVKMSSKIRVLVEGKDDRSHISNVISRLCAGIKFKVDVAAEIKGVCQRTGKNNRAKIEKAHELIKNDLQYKRLFFLCDREVRGFAVNDCVRDEINGHYVDGRLSWTIGHSIENYFITPDLLDSLRYLTSSAYKDQAVSLFASIFPASIRLVATLTLAASHLGNSSFPCGVITWKTLKVDGSENLSVNFGCIDNPIIEEFERNYNNFKSCVDNSELEVCVNLCRGHTAIVLLKRIFAACLFFVAHKAGEKNALSEAVAFDNINETIISSVLSEAWIKGLNEKGRAYPAGLVDAVSAFEH